MWQRYKIPASVLALLGAAAYIVHKMAGSRGWLNFRGDRFWQSLLQVRLSYVALAVALIFSSYVFRSLRWREFMAPVKAGNLGNILASTLVGFSAVALLGRPGELVRPLLIAHKENVSLSSQLGAWTVERIFDGLTVGILMGATLILFPPSNGMGAAGARMIKYLRTGGIVFCGGGVLVAALLAQLRNKPQIPMNILLWFGRALPERYQPRVRTTAGRIVENFSEGLASIGSVYSLAICTAYSVLVWIPVILTYWAVTQSFGPPMSSLGPGTAVLLMAVTVTGSIVQLPGIGGGPQIAMILVLTQLFGIPLEIASTAAMLLWAICFLIVLVPGLPLAAREGLTWQRLRLLAKAGA